MSTMSDEAPSLQEFTAALAARDPKTVATYLTTARDFIEELRSEGVAMSAEQLRHLSPMDWEHIGLTGYYTWDFTPKTTRS